MPIMRTDSSGRGDEIAVGPGSDDGVAEAASRQCLPEIVGCEEVRPSSVAMPEKQSRQEAGTFRVQLEEHDASAGSQDPSSLVESSIGSLDVVERYDPNRAVHGGVREGQVFRPPVDKSDAWVVRPSVRQLFRIRFEDDREGVGWREGIRQKPGSPAEVDDAETSSVADQLTESGEIGPTLPQAQSLSDSEAERAHIIGPCA
jgi:hypothetical protein